MRIKNQKQKGYTIIETMIAISVFIVVVMIGMGSLLNINLLHQKSQDMRSIMDNLNFIMEDMSRNLRTGYNYRCYDGEGSITGDINIGSAASCATGWGIAFEAAGGLLANDDQWAYYINGGKIFKSTDGAVSFIQLNPDEIVMGSASSFSVAGAESGGPQQPFVTVKLVGQITYKNVVTPFTLQTSVSQRLIDI